MAAAPMNLYPVKLTTDDGSIARNCRLVFEEDRTTVYQWSVELGTGVPILTSAGRPERVGATTSYRVDGRKVDPQRGCGCSHPMYAWVPAS